MITGLTKHLQNDGFWAAFRENDTELRIRHAKVGCVLALILMPAGSTLDAVVYPELVWPIFQARLWTNLFIAVVLCLLLSRFAARYVRLIGSVWVFAPAVAISWMIYVTEGPVSPYYAGLNLVIIIGCLLMPYTLWEASTVSLLVLAMYLGACLMHSGLGPLWSAELYSNVYFIVLTSVIAVASCHYYHRRRVEDLLLRHQLDAHTSMGARMSVSGVRNSWLMLAKNSLFSRSNSRSFWLDTSNSCLARLSKCRA